MLDGLILAYRSNFFDWDIDNVSKFCAKNKGLLISFLLLIAIVIIAAIYSLHLRTNVYSFLALLLELITFIILDRLTVKRYLQFIKNKQDHLNNVVVFLKTAIPETSLFSKSKVEALIKRLSERITSGNPLNKFKSRLSKFGSSIIIPIVAYVAGLFTGDVRDLGLVAIVGWAISIILLTGLCYIIWGLLAQGLQKIACRDYDAAVALKEDLLDIDLLFFANDSTPQPSQVLLSSDSFQPLKSVF